jgi:hypothetical protein
VRVSFKICRRTNSRQRISCQPLSGGSDGRRKGTHLAPHDNCRSFLLRSGLRRHVGSCCRARFPFAVSVRNETVQDPRSSRTPRTDGQSLAPPRDNSSHIASQLTLATQFSIRRRPSVDLACSASSSGQGRLITSRASSVISRRISVCWLKPRYPRRDYWARRTNVLLARGVSETDRYDTDKLRDQMAAGGAWANSKPMPHATTSRLSRNARPTANCLNPNTLCIPKTRLTHHRELSSQ